MQALVFGASGQDGHYLTQRLKAQGVQVTGVSRSGPFFSGSVSDKELVYRLIQQIRPDYIFHLAAASTTTHDAWEENHATICNGSLYILEGCRQYAPDARVFLSGSGLQFQNTGNPIRETDPFEASSPYAVSRIHSVYAARYYRSLGLRTYVGYFFNHDSPLRGPDHMAQRIAILAKKVHAGHPEVLPIGDLKAAKEWGFAGDMMEAAWTLVNQEDIFEACLGTGEARTIADWLAACFSHTDHDWKPYVQPNPGFRSPYSRLVSDPATIFSLGWKPVVSFDALAALMMQPEP